MKENNICFSLWGDSPKYWEGSFKNIELVSKLIPDFKCRFYVDKYCNDSLIEKLSNFDNTEIILVDSDTSWHGMFWRFYAIKETDGIYLSRDTDSRISEREIYAINEWLDSDKNFHIMRDHPYHNVPILGGMWGCRGGILNNIEELIDSWKNHTHTKGNWREVPVAGDQNFLGEVIYPLVVKHAFEHSDFNIKFYGEIKKFPTIRNDYEFIGDVFDQDDKRHPEYWKIIKNVIG